jgi:dihydroorotase
MRYLWIALFCWIVQPASAQEFDLLIRGGHVIDAKNQIDRVQDIAISGDKVAKVADNIPESAAKRVIDARGLLVTPGLIDVHVHVFVGNNPKTFADGRSSIYPDDYSFRAGITTVVDCGTSGWRNFPTFKQQVIDQSKTRVLAFLNIFGSGMIGSPQEQQLDDLDTGKVIETINNYRDQIVGIKIGHYSGADWMPFQRALDVGRVTSRPIIIEAHLPKLPLEGILTRMGPGDIYSQSFKHQTADRLSIVDDNGNVRPYVLAAYKKGVLFDVGHGGVSFQFGTAIPALQQGIVPHSFGSDLHSNSINGGMKDMLNIMSKYLNMGMSLKEVVARATWQSAQAIRREDLGQISPGAIADLTVLNIRKGEFGFIDASNVVLKGNRKLECEVTVRAGKVVYDLNGRSSSKKINAPR